MPYLFAQNITYQFPNGEVLFSNLTFSMKHARVGVVGQNGAGKSLLGSLLSGDVSPTKGSIQREVPVTIFKQQSSLLLCDTVSVAAFLGEQTIIEAIAHIEAGDVKQHWFDIVNEQWDLPARLAQTLEQLGLPADPTFPCSKLSGGQLAKLQLWHLFEQSCGLLILDEPSNHLDRDAKQWLIEQMDEYDGPILLISHDRALLREVEETWELSPLGLRVYGGNYDHYSEQKKAESEALERKLNTLHKQRRKLADTANKNREKAAQRNAQGTRLRKSGSQPKVLLDSKKDRATAGLASRVKNEQQRDSLLRDKQQALSAEQTMRNELKFTMQAFTLRAQQAIAVIDGELCFGGMRGLSLSICSGDKVHLTGKNGSGKSTLLKTLAGDFTLRSGHLQLSKPVYYLDQHFAVIDRASSMLDNLLLKCAGMGESEARTLLAGIGFRKDEVFRQSQTLSGGEKMKLAMLIVSNQSTQPFLLLDEPDNHLDLNAKCILASALKTYKGGFMLVSHDADFAEDTGVTTCIDLS